MTAFCTRHGLWVGYIFLPRKATIPTYLVVVAYDYGG